MEIKYPDLYEKFGLFFEGKRRYYKENLKNRDFLLECSSPYKMKIFDTEIQENSWVQMMVEVCIFLNKKFPGKNLLEFKSDWNKFTAFVREPIADCAKLICPGVYLYANYTALHSCWFIQDILNYYDVNLDEVEFVIRRNPYGEPYDVRQKILEDTKKDFTYYLLTNYSIGKEKAQKIINNIDCLNDLLAKVSHSFDDFFLFDSSIVYATYKSKFLQRFQSTRMAENPKNRELVNRYLNYLTNFYRDYGY